MPREYNEHLETGNHVKFDQTVAMGTYHSDRRITVNRTQCSAGCGRYLTEEEKLTHECRGATPARHRPWTRPRRKPRHRQKDDPYVLRHLFKKKQAERSAARKARNAARRARHAVRKVAALKQGVRQPST